MCINSGTGVPSGCGERQQGLGGGVHEGSGVVRGRSSKDSIAANAVFADFTQHLLIERVWCDGFLDVFQMG